MSVIQWMSDGLAGLFAPRVTAAAAQTYTERWCANHTCRANGKTYNEYRERTCGESWCGPWRKIGCC